MSNEDPSVRAETAKDEPTPVSPDIVEEELADEIDNIVPSYGYEQTPMVGLGGSAGCDRRARVVLRGDAGRRRHGVRRGPAPVAGPRKRAPRDAAALDEHARAAGRGRPEGRGEPRLRDSAGQAPDRRQRPPAADRPRARARQARGRGPLLPLAGRHARAARRGGRAVGRRRRRRARHQAHQGARRPDDRAGPGRGRARRHAARRDRHGHGRLGAERRRRCPQRILDYFAHEERSCKLPPEEGPQPASRRRSCGERRRGALREVLVFLRTRTGRDFSYYKRATILRRIARRMQVNGVEDDARLPRVPAHASRRGRRAAARTC